MTISQYNKLRLSQVSGEKVKNFTEYFAWFFSKALSLEEKRLTPIQPKIETKILRNGDLNKCWPILHNTVSCHSPKMYFLWKIHRSPCKIVPFNIKFDSFLHLVRSFRQVEHVNRKGIAQRIFCYNTRDWCTDTCINLIIMFLPILSNFSST